MKRIFSAIIGLALAMASSVSASAASDNMIIKFFSGSDYVRSLSEVGTVVFSGNDITLVFKNGTKAVVGKVSNAKTMVFGNATSAEPVIETTIKASVFPNPVADVLRIEGAQQGDAVMVYSRMGRLERSETVESEYSDVDMSTLPAGLYIVVVGKQAFQVIKK